MNVIVLAIVVTSIILLIYALQMEVQQRLEDESRRSAEESPLLSSDGNSWLTKQPEWDIEPMENVTSSLMNSADQSRCPACGASITANDERCPSCEIAFVTDGISLVTDGIQKWTPRAVGPADGIYRPPTAFRA